MEITVAPVVHGPGIPAGAEDGEVLLDLLEHVVPVLGLGDGVVLTDLARVVQGLVPVGGSGTAGDRCGAERGGVEVGGRGEEVEERLLGEVGGEGRALESLGDEPGEVVAAEVGAGGDDARGGELVGVLAVPVVVWDGAEGGGPAVLGGADGELDDDADAAGLAGRSWAEFPGGESGGRAAALPGGAEPLDGPEAVGAVGDEGGGEGEGEVVGVLIGGGGGGGSPVAGQG